jgi:hypothetical protein
VPDIHATFDVTRWEPQNWSFEALEHGAINRTLVGKSFTGALDATSEAELLTMQASDGEATYVAMERITGALLGKHGSFAIAHSGTVENHEPIAELAMVVIVPSSGTGELTGIRGTGAFRIDEDGTHHLTLHYELDAS